MKILLEYKSNILLIKNSRFIAEAFFVSSQVDARERLLSQKKKYSDASHVCHAFIIGENAQISGMSDDGEPGGTAGRPMLDVLKGSGITNIIVTVTRYFGGTLLGTGGLVHAYGNSVKELLALCKTEELVQKADFSFFADYSFYEEIKRQLANFNIYELKEDFSEEVKLSGKIKKDEQKNFALLVKNLSRGKSSVNFS